MSRCGILAVLACSSLMGCSSPMIEGEEEDVGATGDSLTQALTCYASNRNSLMACYNELLSHSKDRLVITENIYCSTAYPCHLLFNNGYVGPIVIQGLNVNGVPPVIHRTDGFSYPIIDIQNASKIEVRNIEFREGQVNQPAFRYDPARDDAGLYWSYSRNQACDQPQFMGSWLRACKPTVHIGEESSKIFLDRLFVYESKGFPGAVTLGNITDVTIRRSTFFHSWAMGIFSIAGTGPGEHVPVNLRLENNRFENGRCSGTETVANPGVISGNTYIHNHQGAIYHVQGGQLNPMRHTANTIVSDNDILNGSLDEDPTLVALGWHVPGIEVGPNDINSLSLIHNYIRSNSGYGAKRDAGSCGVNCNNGVTTIKYNVVYNNQLGSFWGLDPAALTGNCTDPGCTFARSSGSLWATPMNTCTPDPITHNCSLTINWSTSCQNHGIPQVRVAGGNVFAQSASGSQAAPWISGETRFDLYCGEHLVKTMYVGVN